MTCVKIRGIYSSALTNLLNSNGFSIAQPSDNIRNTFPKIEFEEEYDTQIYDFSDKGGVVIRGEGTEEVCELFRKEFKNIIVQTENTGHIYLGKIIKLDPKTKNIHVDLGLDKVGLLPLKDYWGYVKEGEKILVQLKDEEDDCHILSTKMHLFGPDVVLIEKGFTKVSRKIRDNDKRELLNKIADEECREDWGALWKLSARDKNEDELIEEVKDLYKEYEKVQKDFEKEEDIQILSKGLVTCYIRFDKSAKQKLDESRREMKPTIQNHHDLKTDVFANIVDFSENLIKEGVKEDLINENVKKFIKTRMAYESSIYLIAEHGLDGSTNFLKGRIVEMNEDKTMMKMKRFLKSGSTNSLLGVRVERGDYVLISIKDDREWLKYEYYSESDELKAEYYTVNTNIEIHSNRAVTNSLALAVTEMNGEKKLVNEDVLEAYAEENVISEELKKKATKVAEKLLKKGD